LATSGGGSGLTAPVITPEGNDFQNFLNVDINVAAPANRIQYAATSYGGALPGSTTTAVATHVGFQITSSKRVWARAGDGSNWSAWTFTDFWKWSGTHEQ
jgi:hypothetical protein